MKPLHYIGCIGSICHELTHYGLARWFGAEARLSLSPPEVGYAGQAMEPWQRHVVGAGPLLLGILIAASALLTGFSDRLLDDHPLIWFIAVVQWIHYTLRTSKADLLPSESE